MADMFADRQLKYVIRMICDYPEKYIKSNEEVWFSITKCMLRKYPVFEIIKLIEKAI